MSFSFRNDPQNVTIDAVRVEVGDTVDRRHQVSDEVIDFALVQEDQNVLRAAAKIAEHLAMKHARHGVTRTATTTVDKHDVSAKYRMLADRLRARATSPDALVSTLIDKADHDARNLDTSITQATFKRGFDSNDPSTLTPKSTDL